MASNEHGAIEQNVEHHETNNLTYYIRESELHARSCATMTGAYNITDAKKTWEILRGLGVNLR